jgi:hypothetical protein
MTRTMAPRALLTTLAVICTVLLDPRDSLLHSERTRGFTADPDYWKGEVFVYVGRNQNLKDLKAQGCTCCFERRTAPERRRCVGGLRRFCEERELFIDRPSPETEHPEPLTTPHGLDPAFVDSTGLPAVGT